MAQTREIGGTELTNLEASVCRALSSLTANVDVVLQRLVENGAISEEEWRRFRTAVAGSVADLAHAEAWPWWGHGYPKVAEALRTLLADNPVLDFSEKGVRPGFSLDAGTTPSASQVDVGAMARHSKLTIVMVDDDADEVFVTRKLILNSGIVNDFVSERQPEQLLTTLSGLDSRGYANDNMIVLLDINMPRQDGFETLRKIRANSDFKSLPVIMLSASKNTADVSRSKELGADGYLNKPFRGDAFFSALDKIPRVKKQLVLAA